MLYEAELLVSAPALELEPEAGALTRLAAYFGLSRALDDRRRARLAAALDGVLEALRVCGLDDAVFASRDGEPTFVDREGVPEDLAALASQAGEGPADFDLLRLFVREGEAQSDGPDHAPYRRAGGDLGEAAELSLAIDVEFHRRLPIDGYPLRLRIHGTIAELRATPDERWEALGQRVSAYLGRRFPNGRVHGHEDVPEGFRHRVDELARALAAQLGSEQIDRSHRSALVIPRHPRMADLSELPDALGAGSFATLPGLEAPLRYAFAWPEVHAGLSYQHMLVLDGRGRPVLATERSPVIATAEGQRVRGMPEGTWRAGSAPVRLPVPDLLVFSGHEWVDEARAEQLLAAETRCEGLDASLALTAHERRRFECGSSGPARPPKAGYVDSAGGSRSYSYESSF